MIVSDNTESGHPGYRSSTTQELRFLQEIESLKQEKQLHTERQWWKLQLHSLETALEDQSSPGTAGQLSWTGGRAPETSRCTQQTDEVQQADRKVHLQLKITERAVACAALRTAFQNMDPEKEVFLSSEQTSQSAESQADLGPDVSPGGPLQPTAAGLQQQLAHLSLTSSSISSTLNATPTVTAQNTAGREEDEFDMFPQTRGKSMEESRRGGSTYEDISHSGDLKSRGLAGAVNTKSKPNQHYSSRDKHQVPREIPREFAGYHAGVCGIFCGSLRDLLREFAGSPAGFIGISRGTKSSPATPIFGKPHVDSSGGGAGRLPGADRPRGVLARQSQRADGDPPTSRPANRFIQRVESDAPPHRNTA
ncbi:TOM1-like protein 2 [Branchiostoma belcheri]|nr:TOM1-like protein 2 [Branchiostoma belcheri]